MKAALASLFERIRGANASGDDDIVKRACLESAAEPPAADAAPIALAYSIQARDVGDLLSPIAVQLATGRPAMWRRPSAGAHLLAAGSILHWATPESHVWGTGLDPAEAIGEIDGERIWA